MRVTDDGEVYLAGSVGGAARIGDLGLHAGESFTAIAARLGKAVSTVSREVAADGGRAGYRAWRAHPRAREPAILRSPRGKPATGLVPRRG
jgi:IS30 family transposase